jgi:hypothetical protein
MWPVFAEIIAAPLATSSPPALICRRFESGTAGAQPAIRDRQQVDASVESACCIGGGSVIADSNAA